MRVLATNDFIASFFPQETSYGRLPGAGGLMAVVDDLRTARGSGAWIDTGDLAQGSALGALSDGVWPFLALRDLPIDVAVAGNHELDWGLEHLSRWAAELRFPLLAANASLGLPSTHMMEAGGRALGVVGLTYPDMPTLHPEISVADGVAGLVAPLAAELRGAGADHVILALHDGVDLMRGHPGPVAGTERMRAICSGVRGSVDLVLGGHTLGCHAGPLEGVPFLQPWPFGTQIGVADLHDDGRVELGLVDVEEAQPWPVAGAAAQAVLESQIVGHLPRPLRQAPGLDLSLGQALAEGLLRADDALDATFVDHGDLWNQAPRDGVLAFLPEGSVSMAQLLRVTPLSGVRSAWGGQLVATELSSGETERVLTGLTGRPSSPALAAPAGVVARRARRGHRGEVLALTPFYAARADRLLGRPLGWERIETTWRDGMADALARP